MMFPTHIMFPGTATSISRGPYLTLSLTSLLWVESCNTSHYLSHCLFTVSLAPCMQHVLDFGAAPHMQSYVLVIAEPKLGFAHVVCIYSDFQSIVY
jgi:hypothetical protein